MSFRPTAIDLFCGSGGMSWGLRQSGFGIVAGIDNWQPALRTFGLNHPETLVLDIDLSLLSPQELCRKLYLNPGELDCMVGGPPCQGFSKNIPAAYRFLEDPRNQLFRTFLAFVDEFRPKTVLMENVAEIYNAYDGSVRDEIIDILTDLGYEVKAGICLASDYGVPQHRRRCFFFASKTGITPCFPEPNFSGNPGLFDKPHRSAWSAISDLPVLNNGEGCEPMPYTTEPLNDYQTEMRKNSTELYDHITRKLNDKQMSRITSLQAGQGMKQLPEHLKPKSGYSGAYGRLDFEMVSPTITRWVFHPGSGRFGHPREARLITIREAARLQSFSDEFRFLGTYIEKAHQVGNAVPPLLMQAFAEEIKVCLGHPEAVR